MNVWHIKEYVTSQFLAMADFPGEDYIIKRMLQAAIEKGEFSIQSSPDLIGESVIILGVRVTKHPGDFDGVVYHMAGYPIHTEAIKLLDQSRPECFYVDIP